MEPPIVVNENGDITIFATIEAAVRYLEPVDVRNHEYVAYDSAGFMLRLFPSEPVVTVAGYTSEEPRASELERALRSFVARASGKSVPVQIKTLPDLVAFCVREYGYTE